MNGPPLLVMFEIRCKKLSKEDPKGKHEKDLDLFLLIPFYLQSLPFCFDRRCTVCSGCFLLHMLLSGLSIQNGSSHLHYKLLCCLILNYSHVQCLHHSRGTNPVNSYCCGCY